jgi:hypothetical protein
MKRFVKITLIATVLIFGLFACNLPGGEPPLSVDDQAATIIAATLQEGNENGADVPITATSSHTPAPASTANTPIGSAVPSPTITPTFSTPVLTVIEQTNCRMGPGQDYEVVFTYLPNAKLAILGRYEVENYWLVKSDFSPTGSCWLWGEYAEVSGSYWVVPSVTPPATSTPNPPQAPSIQNWEFVCSAGQMTIEIDWTDRSSNETGYRVLRDGNAIIELPANSNAFTETISLLPGESAEYIIQVFNLTGEVNSTPMNLTC